METSDWFFDKYGPNHGPDEEGNHRWVRDKIREKSVPIDETAIILRLPQRHIDWMFDEVIMRSYYGIKGWEHA